MGSSLPSEKLERSNYSSWEYKMKQYLVGQGYCSYIIGAHEDKIRNHTRQLPNVGARSESGTILLANMCTRPHA